MLISNIDWMICGRTIFPLQTLLWTFLETIRIECVCVCSIIYLMICLKIEKGQCEVSEIQQSEWPVWNFADVLLVWRTLDQIVSITELDNWRFDLVPGSLGLARFHLWFSIRWSYKAFASWRSVVMLIRKYYFHNSPLHVICKIYPPLQCECIILFWNVKWWLTLLLLNFGVNDKRPSCIHGRIALFMK